MSDLKEIKRRIDVMKRWFASRQADQATPEKYARAEAILKALEAQARAAQEAEDEDDLDDFELFEGMY